MTPRISESLSLFRNARNVPPALRRPSRLTWAVAGAAVAAATLTGAAVAGGAGTPAPAAASQAVTTARTFDGVSPAVATALSGRPASQPATAGPAGTGPARGNEVTVRVQPRSGGQPRQAASSGHQAASGQQAASGHQATAAAAPAPARNTQPYQIYDSTTPSAIPAHQAAAVYADGQYSASPSQVGSLGHSLWIDVTGTNYSASVLDVEPGDATPSQAASWVWHRLSANHNALARVYTFRAQWPAVQSAVASLPSWMQARVRWWIADPTGVPHMVPGASATQWYWGPNYDLSTAQPGF